MKKTVLLTVLAALLCFALARSSDVAVPDGYTRVVVPVERTICMTALQLSNFTVLDAHDVVKGITGTKNLFNKDILTRVKDGRIVKIGMEGNFDTEQVLAANPQVIFKAYKDKKVIYCNMKQTPYYEISPVEPDLLLKDFVAIFHPELVEKDYKPTFYYLLK